MNKFMGHDPVKYRSITMKLKLDEMTRMTNSIQYHKSYRKYTNQRMGVHGPLNISEVGSGAMEE
jgi:hypothetical protein